MEEKTYITGKKDFLSYEDALALKEIGFNELCLACYIDEARKDFISFSFDSFECEQDIEDNIVKKNSDFNESLTSPLYQQVFRWFKKEHGIHSFIDIYPTDETPERCWFMIRYMDRGRSDEDFMSGWFDNEELADLGRLRKLIKIVKDLE